MSGDISEQWMKQRIDHSNSQAAKNRNRYPVQEQATQMELWEYVPCGCDKICTCRTHGCTHHWKLKEGIGFEAFRDGFLRMFVDRNQHRPIIGALAGKGPKGLNTRAIGAFKVLSGLENSWQEISESASDNNKTLFCDNWLPESFRDLWSFKVARTSVYLGKQYCVLFPDICVPYDTASRAKIIKWFHLSGENYVEFLSKIRDAFLNCMSWQKIKVPKLRCFDAPKNYLIFDPAIISFRRPEMDYGNEYSPAERPISLVLDKCFYQPKPDKTSYTSLNKIAEQKDIPEKSYVTRPLSGRGQIITVHRYPEFRLVEWGDLAFHLPDEMIQTILGEFFTNHDRWYLLGTSMTEPDPAGLGSFVRNNFPSFSPRHASAIAAILVHEDFVYSKGRKPIELKKIAGQEEMKNLMSMDAH